MPALIDRTGARFGKLTVVGRSAAPGRPKWRCKCDCGGEAVVDGRNLATGNTTSCGCEWSRSVLGDMKGARFSRLTVIEKLPSRRIGKSVFAAYRCECQCGGKIDTLGMSLRNGDTTSCGCAYAEAGIARSLEPTEKRKRLRAANKRREAAIRQATRPFDSELFLFVRGEARLLAKSRAVATGVPHDVDHVIPLRSNLVCGLNNEFNFAVVPSSFNRWKRNRFWPDMPEDSACSR